MNDNACNTQFAVFAKLLFDELYDQFNTLNCEEADGTYEGMDKEAEQTRKNIQGNIASRAYNLAFHAALHINERDCDVLGFEEAVRRIPDMTEWPEEQE